MLLQLTLHRRALLRRTRRHSAAEERRWENKMDLHPEHLDGKQIAVFIWDVTGTCGGSVVLFGIARFRDNDFYVERTEEPLRLPIPEEAWDTLRHVEKDDQTFGPAPYMVMLRLGPLPEDNDPSEYVRLPVPILEESQRSHESDTSDDD